MYTIFNTLYYYLKITKNKKIITASSLLTQKFIHLLILIDTLSLFNNKLSDDKKTIEYCTNFQIIFLHAQKPTFSFFYQKQLKLVFFLFFIIAAVAHGVQWVITVQRSMSAMQAAQEGGGCCRETSFTIKFMVFDGAAVSHKHNYTQQLIYK